MNRNFPEQRVLSSLRRGVNVSRWFRYPAEDSPHHFRTFLTNADLELIAGMGATCVRLALDPKYLHLAYLDEALARLTGRGLIVVLDYHDESRVIESGPAAVDAIESAWRALATHLRNTSPAAVLLEVLNEPVFDTDPQSWFPIRNRLIATIRSAAPEHTLVIGGTNWSSLDALLGSAPVVDDNVVYTFHFYEPFEFTHQGAPWVGGPVRHLSGVRYRAAGALHIERRIAAAAEWARQHGVAVWAGEFGAYPAVAPRLDRLRWLYDVRTALERHGIGWAVWSYDESLGLDRRLDGAGRVAIDWETAAALGLRTTGIA